jgi:DeoR/GlpR family transcriptional regulator of sugar metabolism
MKEDRKLLNQKRKKFIIDLIEKSVGITTNELAEKLGVSLSTIRRDLNSLEKNRLILKTHGGAVPRSFSTSYEDPYQIKSQLQKREKEIIGKVTSSFIKDEDTVIFDSGTTSFQVAHSSKEKHFTAIALDLPVAMELADSPLIDLIVLGGKVREGIYAIIGAFAEEMLKNLHVNKFIMGADAIHIQRGITNATLAETPIKKLAMQMAKEIILVSDSSKFGKISLAHVCNLRDVDKIVTDENLPLDVSRQLEEIGTEVIIAK